MLGYTIFIVLCYFILLLLGFDNYSASMSCITVWVFLPVFIYAYKEITSGNDHTCRTCGHRAMWWCKLTRDTVDEKCSCEKYIGIFEEKKKL